MGDWWDFCQRRVSRKIARLVKKLQLLPPLLCNCIVRDLYFSNTTSSFSYLSLFTSSYDLFSPRFPRENGKLVRVWGGKKQERIFPSIPGALFHRVFVSYFEEFRAKDGDGSLFWRQPGINERHARRIARMYKSLNKSVSKYLYHTFPLSSLVLSDTAEHSETCCSRRSDYSYVVFWRDLKKI